jgi:hypothetical protein
MKALLLKNFWEYLNIEIECMKYHKIGTKTNIQILNMNIPERLTEEGTSPRSSDLTMNLLSILKQGLFQETDCGRWWVRDTTDLCLLWETKIGPGHLWKDKNRPVFGDLSLGFLCWSFCAGPTDVNFTLRPARPRAGSSGHSLGRVHAYPCWLYARMAISLFIRYGLEDLHPLRDANSGCFIA